MGRNRFSKDSSVKARWTDDGSKVSGEEEREESYGNWRISKRMCVWRCYSVNECWIGADISRGNKNVAANSKQRIRRCFASIVLLTSVEHTSRVIESSFDEIFLMDGWRSVPEAIEFLSCGNLKKRTTRVLVVCNHVSAWVTIGRSYFRRKSGLTRDAVQRLLLLDDRYLTCFFFKEKKKKTPWYTARV